MNAQIVIGLGFGDEGKGLTTDLLVQRANNPIVVRFSGGQQAGHTVKVGDKRHVHSNYGSGTLRGVPSYFTEDTCIYLNTISNERHKLLKMGINPKLYVHPLAKVTTPYDVAWNRLTEKTNNHGSVGLGIGATMKRHIETPYKMFAMELEYPILAMQKLRSIRDYYLERLKGDQAKLNLYFELFKEDLEYFLELLYNNSLFDVEDYWFLGKYNDLIFEGSQGVMLDMDFGVFPNVTYAHTTSRNAIKLIRKLDIEDVDIYYVTRSYQTRHGHGWMSDERNITLINNEDETNVSNEWQGSFRIGDIDYGLLNHALKADSNYSSGYPKNLVVTCLDQRPDFSFDYSKLKTIFDGILESRSPEAKNLETITYKF
jgi:adenylosuccinate synthase